MAQYRICCLKADGRVTHDFKIACAHDQEAASEGESVCATGAVEVWDEARLVVRFKARDAAGI